ncbi:MAG: hypothetical protein M1837_004843 [Sclerophora amabilis]|nr:MAG: hypothetical protein M1837_004843 [Sclerophora amabilis]
MAKSLDRLITFLLDEIAVSGEQGTTKSEVFGRVEKFYTRADFSSTSRAGHQNAGTEPSLLPSSSRAKPPQEGLFLRFNSIEPNALPRRDTKFLETVWEWLISHPDVRVDPANPTQNSNVKWSDRPEPESSRESGNVNSEGSPPAAPLEPSKQTLPSLSVPMRSEAYSSTRSESIVKVEGERVWYALTGHGIDLHRCPQSEFALLSIIGAHREQGVTQIDLVRLAGQDNRSVPKRTEALRNKGYIEKRSVFIRGLRTSLLIHRRFARPISEVVDVNSSADPSDKNATTSSGPEAWTGDTIDISALMKAMFDELKSTNIITHNDFKEKLRILGLPWQSRVFSRLIRRLELIGCLRRVRAASEFSLGDHTHKCVKYIREPEGKEWDLLWDLSMPEGVQKGDDVDLTVDAESFGVDHHNIASGQRHDDQDPGPDRLHDDGRVLPQWTPHKPLGNIVLDILKAAGTRGVSTMSLRAQAVGPFYERPLSTMLDRYTEEWHVAQPSHLHHLAIIRDAAQIKRMSFYNYFSHDNFNRIVESGNATWESVKISAKEGTKKKSNGGKSLTKDVELCPHGFPRVPADQILARGTATLRECLQAAKVEHVPRNSNDPVVIYDDDTGYDIQWGRQKPGRPRGSTGQIIKQPVDPNRPRKPLGRPRKYPKGEEPYKSQNQKGTGKRKRGRPAANARPGTDREEDSKADSRRSEDEVDLDGQSGISRQGETGNKSVDNKHTLLSSSISVRPRKKRRVTTLSEKPDSSHVANRRSENAQESPSSRLSEKHKNLDNEDGRSTKKTKLASPNVRLLQPVPDDSPRGPFPPTPSLSSPVILVDPPGERRPGTKKRGRPRQEVAVVIRSGQLQESDKSPRLNAESTKQSSLLSPSASGREGPPDADITETCLSPSETLLGGSSFTSKSNSVNPSFRRSKRKRNIKHVDTPTLIIDDQDNDKSTGESIALPSPEIWSDHETLPEGDGRLTSINGNVTNGIVPQPIRDHPAAVSPTVSGRKTLEQLAGEMGEENTRTAPQEVLLEPQPCMTQDVEATGIQAESISDHQGLQQNLSKLTETATPPGTIESSPVDQARRKKRNIQEKGSINIRRKKLVLSIVEKSGGIYPGDKELWYPFSSRWMSENEDPGKPDPKTVRKVQKSLLDSGQLISIVFTFNNSKGLLCQKTILVMPEIDPESETVAQLKAKMKEADGDIYIPPEAGVSSTGKRFLDNFRHGQKTVLPRIEMAKEPTEKVTLLHRSSDGASLTATAQAIETRKQKAKDRENRMKQKDNERQEKEKQKLVQRLKREFVRLDAAERKDATRQIKEAAASSIWRGGSQSVNPSRVARLHALSGTQRATAQRDAREPARAGVKFTSHNYRRNDFPNVFEDYVSAPRVLATDTLPSQGSWAPESVAKPLPPHALEEGSLTIEELYFARIDTAQAAPQRSQGSLEHWDTGRATIEYQYTKRIYIRYTDPHQPFHNLSGTFGTFFSAWKLVNRNSRQYGEGDNPSSLRDILDRTSNSRVRKQNSSDPITGGFEYGIDKIRRLEEQEQPLNYRASDHQHSTNFQMPSLQDIRGPKEGIRPSLQLPSTIPPQQTRGTFQDDPKPPTVSFERSRSSLKPSVARSTQRTGRLRSMFKTRSLTSAPIEVNEQDFQIGKDKPNTQRGTDPRSLTGGTRRSRGLLTTTLMSEDDLRRLLISITIVRTLTGGLDRNIDWVIVAKLFPQFDPAMLQKRWGSIFLKNKLQLEKLQADFQEEFIAAYEAKKVPPIDYDDLPNYDWNWLVDWVELNLETPSSQMLPGLPRDRRSLDNLYEIRDDPESNVSWRSEYFGKELPTYKRLELSAGKSFSTPLLRSGVGPQTPENHQLKAARSRIRANTITAEDVYNPDEAKAKLTPFGDDVIETALDELRTSRVVVHAHKGRTIPGRNYNITDHFLSSMKKTLDESHFAQAAEYKAALDASFREEGFAPFSYLARDAQVLAVMNLVAHRRVHLVPRNPPMDRFGLTDGSYRTRFMDKSRLQFEMEIRPSPIYVYGCPLQQELPSPPDQHLREENLPIPLWYDIHGNFVAVMWKKALGAVLSVIATRPGVDLQEIERAVRPGLEDWELELLLAWMVEAKALKEVNGGWTTGEWWWMLIQATEPAA